MVKLNFQFLLIVFLYVYMVKCVQDFRLDNSSNNGTVKHVERKSSKHENAREIEINERTYRKEADHCPHSLNKIILSMILKSHDWDSINEHKKERLLKKLSKLYAIPKDYMRLNSVSRKELFDMLRRSIKQGTDKTSKRVGTLGKIDLLIGCGKKYFTVGEYVLHQLKYQQLKEDLIGNELNDLKLGLWIIWNERSEHSSLKKHKREIEGSGEDYIDYDEYDEEGDEESDTITDVPIETHPHRHHHGDSEELSENEFSIPESDITISQTPRISIVPPIKENISERIDDDIGYESSTIAVDLETTVQIQNETVVSASTPVISSGETTLTTTSTTTIISPLTSTTTPEYIEPEIVNSLPMIKNRLPKLPVTAGKPFKLAIPAETFYDNEDGTNLRLEFFDKNGNAIKQNSWIQFDAKHKEIYGLPLEDAVSKWQYKLRASDSKNESVTEILDISVQQHKGHRSVNHEITLNVKLNKKFERHIDWQIRLIQGIVETLNDNTTSNIVVREIRQNHQDPTTATFIYTNETLPKDKCPEQKLNELVKRLDPKKITNSVLPELSVKSVSSQLIGPCLKPNLAKPKPTPHLTKNYPPVPRNQVDRVNATIGHLLVYKVPPDTFYDPEDTTDLKLSLLTLDRQEIRYNHWLQFDSKNQEFFGIPKGGDYGSEEYLLIAEDHEGLTASDALVVVVNHPPKREYSAIFKMTLGIPYENFNNAYMQRKFVERLSQVFGDTSPSNVQIRSIQHISDGENIMISFYNTTLQKYHHRCPMEDIESLRNILFYHDSIIKERVKKMIGSEFNVIGASVNLLGNCNSHHNDIIHERIPIRYENKNTHTSSSDDYLFTFVLPAVLILAMILLASVIACILHRRRLTGKMELGDEEERRSFRSKGIPVIFQDELDEKPELGNKPPIILKNEKPPLLPPSYNNTNLEGENEVDEYVPPPAVIMGGREARGKSPVTPSYRKPPPYVSP